MKKEKFFNSRRCQMTAICGLTGTGKTTIATALAQEIDNDKERRIFAEKEIERLNAVGFKSLKVPESLFCADYNAFSKVKVSRKKYVYLPRNFVSGYDLGTPVEYRDNALLCPYSLFVSDEYSRYARSRAFASFPEFVEYLGQMQRQFNLDIALLFQRKTGVDTILRQLFHRLLIMESATFNYKRNGKIKSTTWVFTEFVSGRGKSAFEWSDNKDLTPMTTEEKKELRKKARRKLTDFFPFSIFVSSQTKVAREQLRFAINERLLENSCCEVKTYTFKDDISELMDTKFFGALAYSNPKCETFEEYKEWAEQVEFTHNTEIFKTETLEDYWNFQQKIKFERPDDYVTQAKAKQMKEKKEKEEKRQKEKEEKLLLQKQKLELRQQELELKKKRY